MSADGVSEMGNLRTYLFMIAIICVSNAIAQTPGVYPVKSIVGEVVDIDRTTNRIGIRASRGEMFVRGHASSDLSVMRASQIMLMKKADVIARRDPEKREWTDHGVTGRVIGI